MTFGDGRFAWPWKIDRTAARRKAYYSNMHALITRLRQNTWAVFLLHQAVIFVSGFAFISVIRRLTGRDIHLGREPVGLWGGIALIILSVAVIAFTVWLYRWAKGPDAPPLGIGFSVRRSLEFLAGLVIGSLFALLPWLIALWNGSAGVTDRIGAHYDTLTAAGIFAGGFFLLSIQGVMEEVTNRAFPMRLWEHRPLLYRLVVPAVFFAALHLAGEGFGFERAVVLVVFAVALGLAYALTGNIWLATGLHVGGNVAVFSMTGLWHAGAVVSVSGEPAYPVWAGALGMLAVMGLVFWRRSPKY